MRLLQGLTGGSGAGRGWYRVGAPHASRMGEGAGGSVLFGPIILHSTEQRAEGLKLPCECRKRSCEHGL